MQDPAADIGKRLRCDKWAVEHFVEEVIRSGPAVSLSLVLRQLNKRLRETAELGAWQIISAADGQGVVEVVKSLKEVQYKVGCMSWYSRGCCLGIRIGVQATT